jgi:hypothetical protein
MTETYDVTPGGADYAQDRPSIVKHGATRIEQKSIDFAADMLGVTNAAGDYLDIIDLGIGDVVDKILFQITDASATAGSTVNIGDSVAATTYKSALSVAATGFTGFSSTTVTVYSAANAIRVTLGTTAPVDGVLDVSAAIMNFYKPE